jgi:dihydroorotate dehydrogenase (NAD+) catalytic subunit
MSAVDMSVRLDDLVLPHPVMNASGCGGFGRELGPVFPLTELAAFVTRSVTRDASTGGPARRLAETPSGLLSISGPPNPGIDGFLARDLPWLAQHRVRTVVSITGSTPAEYAELARRVGNSPGASAIEVHLGDAAGDPHRAATLVAAARRETPRGVPTLAKLSPDVASVADVARAVVDAGAAGVVLVDGSRALAIDLESMRPLLGLAPRLSGPAIRPIALRCVWEVHSALPTVPIVGVGGVASGSDAFALLLAGATAVQVGSMILHDPSTPVQVRDELASELSARGFQRAVDAIGYAHGWSHGEHEEHEEHETVVRT